MNNVWLSAFLGDGKNARVKHIICDSEGNPLVFDTQLNALEFWIEEKSKFDVSVRFIGHENVWRVTPQVVKGEDVDTVLYGKLEEDYEELRPKHQYSLYATSESNPEWL